MKQTSNMAMSSSSLVSASSHTTNSSSTLLSSPGKVGKKKGKRKSIENMNTFNNADVPKKIDNDNYEDIGDDIQVCLRLRPMDKLERSRRSRNCVEIHEGRKVNDDQVYDNKAKQMITVDSPADGTQHDFSFDKVRF